MNKPEMSFSGHSPPGASQAGPAGTPGEPGMQFADALKIAIELLEATIDFLGPYSGRRSGAGRVAQRLRALQSARRLLIDQRAALRREAILAGVRSDRRAAKGGGHAVEPGASGG